MTIRALVAETLPARAAKFRNGFDGSRRRDPIRPVSGPLIMGGEAGSQNDQFGPDRRIGGVTARPDRDPASLRTTLHRPDRDLAIVPRSPGGAGC